VLSGCGAEEAERKRLELQKTVDLVQFEARPGKMLPIAISIGASIFPHDGDSYENAARDGRQPDVRDKTRRKRTLLRRIARRSQRPGPAAISADREPVRARLEASGDRIL